MKQEGLGRLQMLINVMALSTAVHKNLHSVCPGESNEDVPQSRAITTDPAVNIRPHGPAFSNVCPISCSFSSFVYQPAYTRQSSVLFLPSTSIFPFFFIFFHPSSYPLTLSKWPQDVAAIHLHLVMSQVNTYTKKTLVLVMLTIFLYKSPKELADRKLTSVMSN